MKSLCRKDSRYRLWETRLLQPRILLLESSWAESMADYMTCTKSSSKIYGLLSTLALDEYGPVNVIEKPLLAHRFQIDIAQFADTQSLFKGVHTIIISGHGADLFQPGGKSVGFNRDSKGVRCIDGEISLIEHLRPIREKLKHTLLIIDACRVGTEVHNIVKQTGVYGCVGFSKSVPWTDSTLFVLALLLNLFEFGIFHGNTTDKAKKILQSMQRGAYGSLMRSLKVEYAFQPSPQRKAKSRAG